MTQYITEAELEHLTETELRSKFCQILDDLARSQQAVEDCPLIRASLDNIQRALYIRRQRGPKL